MCVLNCLHTWASFSYIAVSWETSSKHCLEQPLTLALAHIHLVWTVRPGRASLEGLTSGKGTTESERSRPRKSAPHVQCTSHSEVKPPPELNLEDLLQPLSLFFLYHAFKMRRKSISILCKYGPLRLKCYWRCFQLKQQHLSYLLVLFFCCLIKV